MRPKHHITTLLFCLTFFFARSFTGTAQSNSAGFSVSHLTYSATFAHYEPNGCFHDIQIGLDIDGLFDEKVKFPGISASYSYNFILLHRNLSAGGQLKMFAGPGFTVGWVNDYRTSFGLLIGAKADFGVEYSSERIPFTIGGKISPTLGLHTSVLDDHWFLSGYTNGFMKALIPELTVKYDLGRKTPQSGFKRGEGSSDDYFPRFTFGIESAYIPVFARYIHYNYVDSENTRHFDNSLHGGYWSRGEILVHAGVNVNKNLNLSLYSGWASFGHAFEGIPLLLRGTWFFGNDPNADRWFTHLDAGPAFALYQTLESPAVILSAGGGYRLSLNRYTKLDLGFGLFSYHSHPRFVDSVNTTISSETGVGLKLSVGVSF